MNRMLKTIGLALCAAFALSAVAVATASAATHHFTGPVGSKVEVVDNNTQLFRATTNDKKFISCEEVSAEGEITAETDDELTVKPKYQDCEAVEEEGAEVTAFVDASQCAYVFQGQTTAGNPTGGEHANVVIEKVGGVGTCHINVTLTALKLKCVSIPNQTVTDAVTYEQINDIGGGKKGIRVTATPHSIESTTTHSAACPTPNKATVVHDGHTETSGLYTGTVDVALTKEGATQDFTLTKNAT